MKRVRMTATTKRGTTYSASVSRNVSQENLEALDALADAVMEEWERREAAKPPKPEAGPA